MRPGFRCLALLVPVALLAGCGGSGGGDAPPPDNLADYQDLAIDLANLPPTGLGDMPASGSARYEGFANIGINPAAQDSFRAAAVGELSLTVDFAGSGRMSGQADTFQYLDQTAIPGRLSIDGGTISGNRIVAADADGRIDGFDLDMLVDGDFQGDGARALYLWFDGTTTSGATGTLNTSGIGIAGRR